MLRLPCLAICAASALSCGPQSRNWTGDKAEVEVSRPAPELAGGGAASSDTEEPDDTPQRYRLLWEDEFDALDAERWKTAEHSFKENGGQFSASQVRIEDGYLRLSVASSEGPTADGKSYLAAEIRTLDTFRYGRFETRARFARGSGLVNTFLTLYDYWEDPVTFPEDWNEIHVRVLGVQEEKVWFNAIYWGDDKSEKSQPLELPTSFKPELSFHEYAFEWAPERISYFLDGRLVHQATGTEQKMVRDQKLMLSLWPVEATEDLTAWAGQFQAPEGLVAAYFDWVRVWELVGD